MVTSKIAVVKKEICAEIKFILENSENSASQCFNNYYLCATNFKRE